MTCHIITRLGEQLVSGRNLSYEIFSDEEPLDLIAYQLDDRSFKPTFHCSKYNKKVFPGGFQPNVVRSKKTPHRDIDESSRNWQLQRKIQQSSSSTLPSRTSFMFWARGFPSRSTPEVYDHRVTVPEPLAANPPPSGFLLRYWYTNIIYSAPHSFSTLLTFHTSHFSNSL